MELTFQLAESTILVALAVLWTSVAYGAIARQHAAGRPVLVVAIISLYSGAPLALWAVGSHRSVSDYAKLPVTSVPETAVGRLSVVLLGVLLVSAALYVLTTKGRMLPGCRQLWLAYLGFSAGPVLAMAWGSRPGLRYTFLLAPAAMTVIYLLIGEDPDKWTILIRRLLLLYVWSSIAVAVVRPEWAFELQSRATLLFGTRPRLVGVTATPNSLGPIAATALLIVSATARGRWRVLNGAIAGIVLVLTDSRMAMAGAAVGLLVIFINKRRYGKAVRTLVAASLLSLPCLFLLGSDSPLERVAEITDGSLSTRQVSTLSGRVDVWETTLAAWRENPAFGYGPSLWSPEHRAQFGQRFNWVGQAHNQWVQTLGDSGLVGLGGLFVYVVVMIRTAFLTSANSGGLTGALVALLLVRMLSESALRNPRLDVITMLHVMTFTVLIAHGVRRPNDSNSPPERSSRAYLQAAHSDIDRPGDCVGMKS